MLHLAEARLRKTLWTPPTGWREWLDYLRRSERGATGTALADFLENELLDHVLSKATYTAPDTTYIAAFTVAPGDSGGGTEVSGGSYARVAYTNNATNWPAASGGSKSNAVTIDFGTATADWGTIVAVAIIDAATSGNFMFHGALTNPKTINSGDGFRFLPTKLSVALD